MQYETFSTKNVPLLLVERVLSLGEVGAIVLFDKASGHPGMKHMHDAEEDAAEGLVYMALQRAFDALKIDTPSALTAIVCLLALFLPAKECDANVSWA